MVVRQLFPWRNEWVGWLWMCKGWAKTEGGRKLKYSFSIFCSELEKKG